jgi:hypothetical protein
MVYKIKKPKQVILDNSIRLINFNDCNRNDDVMAKSLIRNGKKYETIFIVSIGDNETILSRSIKNLSELRKTRNIHAIYVGGGNVIRELCIVNHNNFDYYMVDGDIDFIGNYKFNNLIVCDSNQRFTNTLLDKIIVSIATYSIKNLNDIDNCLTFGWCCDRVYSKSNVMRIVSSVLGGKQPKNNNILFSTKNKHRILFLISNYERYDMLKKLISELDSLCCEKFEINYVIFDDKSSYSLDYKNVIVNDVHRGKMKYWKTFDDMFKLVGSVECDTIIFTPNDFIDYNFDRLFNLIEKFGNDIYVLNIINDGRVSCWNGIERVVHDDELYRDYYCDCGFITNKNTMNLIGYYINPISINYNKYNEMSSGVGRQLTDRLNSNKIPIFTPIKSLAYHGNHESLMNKQIRKKNKLISL